jgi:hypothetical protein
MRRWRKTRTLLAAGGNEEGGAERRAVLSVLVRTDLEAV